MENVDQHLDELLREARQAAADALQSLSATDATLAPFKVGSKAAAASSLSQLPAVSPQPAHPVVPTPPAPLVPIRPLPTRSPASGRVIFWNAMKVFLALALLLGLVLLFGSCVEPKMLMRRVAPSLTQPHPMSPKLTSEGTMSLSPRGLTRWRPGEERLLFLVLRRRHRHDVSLTALS